MKKGKAIHHSTVNIRVESYTTAYFCSLAGFMFVRGPGLGIRSLAFQANCSILGAKERKSESLMVALLLRATGAIRSRSLFKLNDLRERANERKSEFPTLPETI